MARFLIDEIQGDIALFLEDAQHMARILRLKPGDFITALDGRGRQAQAAILSIGKDVVRAQLSSWQQASGEPSIHVSIFQGICRGERFETVVQKCSELGAADITPLSLSRCEFKPSDMDKKLPRLQKIAREAAKQSGRGIIPQVNPTIRLTDIRFSEYDLILCPYEEAKAYGLKTALCKYPHPKRIAVLIGPEGGLEASEAAYCGDNGAQVITLGPRILRTETAAPAVVSVLMAMTGQWDGEAD